MAAHLHDDAPGAPLDACTRGRDLAPAEDAALGVALVGGRGVDVDAEQVAERAGAVPPRPAARGVDRRAAARTRRGAPHTRLRQAVHPQRARRRAAATAWHACAARAEAAGWVAMGRLGCLLARGASGHMAGSLC